MPADGEDRFRKKAGPESRLFLRPKIHIGGIIRMMIKRLTIAAALFAAAIFAALITPASANAESATDGSFGITEDRGTICLPATASAVAVWSEEDQADIQWIIGSGTVYPKYEGGKTYTVHVYEYPSMAWVGAGSFRVPDATRLTDAPVLVPSSEGYSAKTEFLGDGTAMISVSLESGISGVPMTLYRVNSDGSRTQAGAATSSSGTGFFVVPASNGGYDPETTEYIATVSGYELAKVVVSTRFGSTAITACADGQIAVTGLEAVPHTVILAEFGEDGKAQVAATLTKDSDGVYRCRLGKPKAFIGVAICAGGSQFPIGELTTLDTAEIPAAFVI